MRLLQTESIVRAQSQNRDGSYTPNIWNRFNVVILSIKFFFAKSNLWMSFVMFRTTASDSVAFSRIRDICPRRSYIPTTVNIPIDPERCALHTEIISCMDCIRCGSWLSSSSARSLFISSCNVRSSSSKRFRTDSIWLSDASCNLSQ